MCSFIQFSKIPVGGYFRARGAQWIKVPPGNLHAGQKYNAIQPPEVFVQGTEHIANTWFPHECLVRWDPEEEKAIFEPDEEKATNYTNR